MGALLAFIGAVGMADSRRWSADLGMGAVEALTISVSISVTGVVTFIAAACAILRTIAGA
jgi:hypothetical protein